MSETPTWTADAHSNLVVTLVLDIIDSKKTYGYEIKKLVEGIMNEVYINYEFKISSLYTLLRRLEKENLIESFKDIDNASNERDKNRTFYTITLKGKEALNQSWEEWNLLCKISTIAKQQLESLHK